MRNLLEGVFDFWIDYQAIPDIRFQIVEIQVPTIEEYILFHAPGCAIASVCIRFEQVAMPQTPNGIQET